MLTGAGPDVDSPIRCFDRFLVVLDDDQGVTQIPEPEQRLDEPSIVPLVQPDAGLVEHIEDTNQP